jgi:hypothetical protein
LRGKGNDADFNGQCNSGYGAYGLNAGIGQLDDDAWLEIAPPLQPATPFRPYPVIAADSHERDALVSWEPHPTGPGSCGECPATTAPSCASLTSPPPRTS